MLRIHEWVWIPKDNGCVSVKGMKIFQRVHVVVMRRHEVGCLHGLGKLHGSVVAPTTRITARKIEDFTHAAAAFRFSRPLPAATSAALPPHPNDVRSNRRRRINSSTEADSTRLALLSKLQRYAAPDALSLRSLPVNSKRFIMSFSGRGRASEPEKAWFGSSTSTLLAPSWETARKRPPFRGVGIRHNGMYTSVEFTEKVITEDVDIDPRLGHPWCMWGDSHAAIVTSPRVFLYLGLFELWIARFRCGGAYTAFGTAYVLTWSHSRGPREPGIGSGVGRGDRMVKDMWVGCGLSPACWDARRRGFHNSASFGRTESVVRSGRVRAQYPQTQPFHRRAGCDACLRMVQRGPEKRGDAACARE
ncbi:hypothetical protein JB92DRAFT_3202395 [Gautieria morchelliformis]|nr:hypothetical protein JB92DRAFT_3202395 [Gautieria morchelliformis]